MKPQTCRFPQLMMDTAETKHQKRDVNNSTVVTGVLFSHQNVHDAHIYDVDDGAFFSSSRSCI